MSLNRLQYQVLFVALFASFQAVLNSSAHSNELLQLVKAIKNPEAGVVSDFGSSFTITSQGVVIGASLDSEAGKDAGAIYFFDHNGEFQRKVVQPDAISGANFGLSVDVTSYDTVIVGNYTQTSRGAVYEFDLDGDLLRRYDPPTDVIAQFGTGIAAKGETVLIGSLRDSTAADQGGAVYAYVRGEESPRRFVAPNAVPLSLLGNSITSLDGSMFAAAAYTESVAGAFATGAVYIFDLNSSEVVHIPDPNPRDYNYFGIETGRVGNNVLVGALEQEGNVATGGVAYMFDQQGNLLQQFNNPHPDVDDFFGYDLTGIGDYVVIGAPSDGTTGRLAGAAYVFDQQGNLLQEMHDPTPGDAGSFGLVQSFGDTLVISASYDGGGPTARGPGAVYIYKLNLLPGDVDMNGVVNLLDFASLRTHFGQDVDARADGDLTGDLHVDIHDFAELRANFNRRQTPVPEPGVLSGALFVAFCGLASLRGRCPILLSPRR